MPKAKQLNPFAHPTAYKLPTIPAGRRICPGCLDPMPLWYGWFSSERVVHLMFKCECGTRVKVKLLHARINKKGQLE